MDEATCGTGNRAVVIKSAQVDAQSQPSPEQQLLLLQVLLPQSSGSSDGSGREVVLVVEAHKCRSDEADGAATNVWVGKCSERTEESPATNIAFARSPSVFFTLQSARSMVNKKAKKRRTR